VKELDPDLQATLKRVRDDFESAKDVHEQARRRWERYYALYRSYKDMKRSWRDATQEGGRDVASVLRDAQSTFGQSLFIPYVFSVIETTLPRTISSNPKIPIRPRRPEWEDNVEPVRLTMDAQQQKVGYPLILQDVAKSGLTYGLGVQGLYWDTRVKKDKTYLRRATDTSGGVEWVEAKKQEVVYEGPMPECIDIFDWIWSPRAHDHRTLRWCINRSWRDNAYVKEMLDRGAWTLPDGWDFEADIRAMGSREKHDETWQFRMEAAGFTRPDARGDQVHEIWEWHDGTDVVTVIDRALPVQVKKLPYWHQEIPFQVYRPTRVLHEMVGIGEPEAIEDLQRELNELRSNRRDNAKLVLQRPFFYYEGMMDPNEIAFGPGIANAVETNPSEAVYFPPVQDLPESGYREEAALQSDIERITGIDDTVSGAAGGQTGAAATATGVQMVQQAASIRISNKTKRLVEEVVKPGASQWTSLNQQHILEDMPIIGPPKPGEADRRWSWYTIGPEQLAGEFEFDYEEGSMAPDNTVQDRQDGLQFFQMFGQDPLLDPVKVREYALKKYGLDNPEGYLRPQEPQIPEHVFELVAQALQEEAQTDPRKLMAQLAGDPTFLQTLLQGAMAHAQDQAPMDEQGPPPEGAGAADPAQNGNGGPPQMAGAPTPPQP
jgi:hypothetical protein